MTVLNSIIILTVLFCFSVTPTSGGTALENFFTRANLASVTNVMIINDCGQEDFQVEIKSLHENSVSVLVLNQPQLLRKMSPDAVYTLVLVMTTGNRSDWKVL